MTRETVSHILDEAADLGTIEWIYFEGGEPFLDYALLLWGVKEAHQRGFKVGIVSNAYWAETEAHALEKLRPFAGLVADLSISDDAYHGAKDGPRETTMARQAARELGIPVDFITIHGPDASASPAPTQWAGEKEANVRYRGRAADKLAPLVKSVSWERFTQCPWEDLRQPQRLHVDSLGNLHICQGLAIGNLADQTLSRIMRNYDPDTHPVIGPLLKGGPAALTRRYDLEHRQGYADACHLCYQSRKRLRERFPEVLTPAQMYGEQH